MAEEILENSTSIMVGPTLKNHGETEVKTEAKKTAASNATAKGGNKQKKLFVHLWIGFLMTALVITGYVFFGPAAHVQAAEPAGIHFVNVSNNAPDSSAVTPNAVSNAHIDDLSILQAEMDAITRQMEALEAGNLSMKTTTSKAGSETYGSAPGYGPGLTKPTLNQMITRTNSIRITPPGGMSSPASGGGHGH